MKPCRKCRVEKPIGDFVSRFRLVKKECHYCKICRDKRGRLSKSWAERNPDKHREMQRRTYQKNFEQRKEYGKRYEQDCRKADPEKFRRSVNRRRAKRLGYGIPDNLFNRLEKKRSGPCCICGSTPEVQKNAHSVDHDHTSGVFRGILCSRCNMALGLLKEDPQRCEAMSEYIRSPPGLKWLED